MIITADFSGVKPTVTTESLYQWDIGQRLKICGLSGIDESTQVHFANVYMNRAIVKEGIYSDGELVVDIPNEVLQYGNTAPVRAWVYINSDNDGRYTLRTAQIPVTPRKRPNDYVSPEDPDAQGIIEQAVELLENYERDITGKVSKPIASPNGTNGQLLRTLGDGTTEWVNAGLPTDAQTATAVSEWLDDHPEATTTVEDGAVTAAKLGSGAVTAAKLGADVNTILDGKVIKPSTSPNGTNGQLLRTKGDGTTEWADVGLPTDAQTSEAVSDWLDDHPEATTTVEDGSVTLAKLHSGVIDSTLSTQGAAAEAKTTGNKIAVLNSAVDEVKNAAGVPTEQLYQRPYIDLDDYSDGTALKTDGSTMTHSNAVCSKYILIGGSSITVNLYAIKDSSAAVCFYDSAKNFISALAPSEGTSGTWRLVNGTYSIPQNTWYIRCSFMKSNSSSAVAANQYISFTELQSSGEWCNKNNEDIGDIKGDLILAVNKRIRFSEIPNPQDAYINTSGAVTSYSAAKTSDLIPINGNTQITVDLWTIKGLARAVAFYDGNGSYISGINASEGTSGTWQHLTGTFTVPETAVKFRFTVKKENAGINGNVTKQFVLYNANTQIKNIVSDEYPDYNPWRYKKWCAFGTSLTDTSFMNTETGEVTGKYVPFLAETSQMFVTNRGIAGGTLGSGGVSGGSSTILNAILNSSDLSSYDLITVEGFVNDFACGVAIGSIGDTANTTMYGAMYQAIKYIQENSNATLVFITDSTGQYYEFTQSSGTGDYRVTRKNGLNLLQQDYNDAVIKCCQYYGVPVIDAGGRSQIDQYRPQYIIDQIHHTTLGGKQYAQTIWAELKNIYPACSS